MPSFCIFEGCVFLEKWSQMHIDGPSQIPNKLFITCHCIIIYNVEEFSIDRYLHVSNTYAMYKYITQYSCLLKISKSQKRKSVFSILPKTNKVHYPFLVQMRTRKFASEIYWPLKISLSFVNIDLTFALYYMRALVQKPSILTLFELMHGLCFVWSAN